MREWGSESDEAPETAETISPEAVEAMDADPESFGEAANSDENWTAEAPAERNEAVDLRPHETGPAGDDAAQAAAGQDDREATVAEIDRIMGGRD